MYVTWPSAGVHFFSRGPLGESRILRICSGLGRGHAIDKALQKSQRVCIPHSFKCSKNSTMLHRIMNFTLDPAPNWVASKIGRRFRVSEDKAIQAHPHRP